jgi:threonylcarbamoyladenosine tRNA methylthiotransferase MtaB
MATRIAFSTLGCKQNQFETEALKGILSEEDYAVVPFTDEADLYVINTCTVTAEADADSRQMIRRAIRRNPAARVVVTGCYAQVSPHEVRAIPGVDLVLGNGEKPQFLLQIEELRRQAPSPVPSPSQRERGNCLGGEGEGEGARVPRVVVSDIGRRRVFDGLRVSLDSDRTRAYLKVQDGCNYHCSFCIVPVARGPNRSLPPEPVLDELQRLDAAGYPEVVLTAIHLGTYGRDLSPPTSLVALLRRIEDLPLRCRVRLTSLDPHEVGDDLIELMQGSRRFCRHLHIAVQSGDDGVLRAMRRAYPARRFREAVERAAAAIPGIGIGGDAIVGFPGETDAAFENTYRLLADLPICYFHVFPYSRRPGTAAASLRDQVPPNVRAERSRRLRAVVARKAAAFREALAGKVVDAVVLHRRERDGRRLEALTDNYARAFLDGPDELMGRRAALRLGRGYGPGLAAVPVEGPALGIATQIRFGSAEGIRACGPCLQGHTGYPQP